MKIQILGSGCPTCKRLYESVRIVAQDLNLERDVEYLTGSEGIKKIIELGAMSSPVLAINDHIVMTGYTGDEGKIKALLQAHLQ